MSNPSSVFLADLLRALFDHHIGPMATEKGGAEETQRFHELIAKLEKANPEARRALWDEYMRPQRQRSQEKSLQPKRRTPWQLAIRHLHKKAGINESAVREFLCKRRLAEMQGMDLAFAEDGSEDLADDLAELECNEGVMTSLIQLLRHKFPKEMAGIMPEDVNHKSAVQPKKGKRSTERGEGREKLISALTKHHKYADGGCLNLEPIGNNALARLAEVAKRTASAFFKAQFQGHAKYMKLCQDAAALAYALKELNNEFSLPERIKLFGRRPPGEDDRDDDDI